MNKTADITLGLRANKRQFALLVLINAFVGGMIGLERSILPELATTVFGMASKSAILSFITAFGLTKALTNYFTGRLANRFGRKNLLVMGWILALPIPFLLIYAPNWSWIVGANILLGMSQGLTWSSTVVMKIDLVGEKDRGLAMGLNEFAGYLAVGLVSLATGYVAAHIGIRPYPFYIGIVISFLGLILSLFWVKDTRPFLQKEAVQSASKPLLAHIFWDTTYRNTTLSAVTQAGLVNNLNDGMMWGLLPLWLAAQGQDSQTTTWIIALYPTIWGIGQLFTGRLSDIMPHKTLLFWGMLLQGLAILAFMTSRNSIFLITLSAILGFGTALVYPTFLSAIAQATDPLQRAESLGTFRLWRDLGYAVGALFSGILADAFGLSTALTAVGLLTILSAVIIQNRMPRPNI